MRDIVDRLREIMHFIPFFSPHIYRDNLDPIFPLEAEIPPVFSEISPYIFCVHSK